MIETKTEQGTKGRALALGLLAVTLMAAWLVLAARPAHAATFTVNSTADGGDRNPGDGSCFTGILIPGDRFATVRECTLRAAIEEVNATTAADTINFNISGAGPHTISPASELPRITQPVTINGYSQPGSSPNTATTGTNAVLEIVLDRSNIFERSVSGLDVRASNSTVEGLVINGWDWGVILGYPRYTGITLEGSFIGTDATGTTASGNVRGVTVGGTNNVIGGTTPAARNLISGNVWGVIVGGSGSGNEVQGNLIGTTKDGNTALGNDFSGVHVDLGGSGNAIGGNGAARNTIAFNRGDGVEVRGDTGNSILRNSIFSNGELGIDLRGGTETGSGVTANDLLDIDAGPNGLQNYPVITDAVTAGFTTTISGRLNSTPNKTFDPPPKKTFTLEFFSNPPGAEEGQQFIGQKSVTTNSNGNVRFTFAPAGKVPAGQTVTATATGAEGTSEFSAPRTVRTVIGP